MELHGLGHDSAHCATREVFGPHSGPYRSRPYRRVRCADLAPLADVMIKARQAKGSGTHVILKMPEITDRFWLAAATNQCIAAIWIAFHPYQGIFHDTRLYTIQALSHLEPTRYSDDLSLFTGLRILSHCFLSSIRI